MARKLVILGSVPSLKNSKQLFVNKRTGKRFITSSTRSKEWVESALWQLKGQKPVTEYPVALTVLFTVADNRGRDMDNMLASVMDVLQTAGVIESDNWQHCRPITIDVAGVDKDAKVEVWFD